MWNICKCLWFKPLSLALAVVLTFLDIIWAYPAEAGAAKNSLAVQASFQKSMMSEHGESRREALFNDIGLDAAFRSIAVALFGNEMGDRPVIAPNRLEITLREILGPSGMDYARENIGFSKIHGIVWKAGSSEKLQDDETLPRDSIVLIPFSMPDGESAVLQITPEGSSQEKELLGNKIDGWFDGYAAGYVRLADHETPVNAVERTRISSSMSEEPNSNDLPAPLVERSEKTAPITDRTIKDIAIVGTASLLASTPAFAANVQDVYAMLANSYSFVFIAVLLASTYLIDYLLKKYYEIRPIPYLDPGQQIERLIFLRGKKINIDFYYSSDVEGPKRFAHMAEELLREHGAIVTMGRLTAGRQPDIEIFIGDADRRGRPIFRIKESRRPKHRLIRRVEFSDFVDVFWSGLALFSSEMVAKYNKIWLETVKREDLLKLAIGRNIKFDFMSASPDERFRNFSEQFPRHIGANVVDKRSDADIVLTVVSSMSGFTAISASSPSGRIEPIDVSCTRDNISLAAESVLADALQMLKKQQAHYKRPKTGLFGLAFALIAAAPDATAEPLAMENVVTTPAVVTNISSMNITGIPEIEKPSSPANLEEPAYKIRQIADIISGEANNVNLRATSSIVSSAVARAYLLKAKKDNKKLMICLEDTLLPGMGENERGAGTAHDAMNPIMRELGKLKNRFKSLGFDNIEFINSDAADIAVQVANSIDKNETSYENVIIFANPISIERYFGYTKNIRGKKPFLASFDLEAFNAAKEVYENRGPGEVLDIQLAIMVYMVLESALRSASPDISGHGMRYEYNGDSWIALKFYPSARLINCNDLRDRNMLDAKFLESA